MHQKAIIHAPAVVGVALFLGVLLLFASSLGTHTPLAKADNAGELVGYAWSSGGWISFNCKNEDVCTSSNYAVSEDSNGFLSGYAWAGNIGSWITFNSAELVGCPSGACEAKVDPASGTLSGWARACGAFQNKSICSGALETGSGGWDGWIHLAGTTGAGGAYGPTQLSDCSFSPDYSWGGDNLGWIKWSGPGYSVRGVGTGCNQTTAFIQAVPNALSGPATTTISWIATNAVVCTGSNFSTNTATSGTKTIFVNTTTIYGVTCTGPSGSASANALVSVASPSTAVSLTAQPTSIQPGESATLNWSAVNVEPGSCAVRNPSGAVIGSGTVGSGSTGPVNNPSTFTYTCTSSVTGNPETASITVGVIPIFQEK